MIYSEVNGTQYIDVTYPLHDQSGKAIGTAGLTFDMSEVSALTVPSSFYTATIIMIIVSLVIGLFVSYTIAKPIKQLKVVADKVTDGDFLPSFRRQSPTTRSVN